MFDGVCFCTHSHLSLCSSYTLILAPSSPLSLSLPLYLSKVLALQTEAEKEKAEAKRKIAKLEEALRYDGKRLNRELC